MSEQTSTPTFADQVPETDFPEWASAVRTDLQTYIKTHVPDLASKRDPFEAIDKKLSSLTYAIAYYDKAESTAREEFIAWLEENDTGAWGTFVAHTTRMETLKAQEKERKDKDSLASKALEEAQRLTRKYGAGAGRKAGTVIAVVSHAGTGKTWSGTSGEYSLSTKHPLMAKVLTGVSQVEDWPITACGEVAAMNAYLNSTGITEMAKIPKDMLYFHAQTWNATGGKWQARSACGNCDQWLKKIGAKRI
ncbi:hypothetical protein [Streptosporangium sp. NPDC049046]|uniref:hypothetical protein n=1 Tax=unclassified Streptosporangium TaxID=2632669 RepID=UPI00342E0DCA